MDVSSKDDLEANKNENSSDHSNNFIGYNVVKNKVDLNNKNQLQENLINSDINNNIGIIENIQSNLNPKSTHKKFRVYLVLLIILILFLLFIFFIFVI